MISVWSDNFIDEFLKTIRKDGSVKVKELGTFTVIRYKGGPRRHPLTGEMFRVKPYNRIKFKPFKIIKDGVRKVPVKVANGKRA